MDQKLQQSDKRDHIIAKLEADLAHAYTVITELQEQLAELQNDQSQQSTLLVRGVSLFPSEKSRNPTKQSLAGYPDTEVTDSSGVLTRRRGSDTLSLLQFASLVTVVAVVMTIIGLAMTRRQNPRPVQPAAAPSVILRSTPNCLPLPLVIPASPRVTPSPLPQPRQKNLELAYNVRMPPSFKKSQELQATVNEVVDLADAEELPKKPLSITLIDAKTGEYAQYQEEDMRYPASVVKMFWMVDLYAQIEKGWLDEAAITPYLNKMIKKSDNEAASYILDRITGTKSGEKLEGEEYQTWLNKRRQVTRFFREAGYKDINISQKTFPIPYLKLYEPKGRDLEMRGDPKAPIRNKITTQHAARLLYEIYEGQAVSPVYSQKMADLLTIDSATRVLNKEQQSSAQFNPVRGFLSQSLPTDVYFAAKAGWTSGSRQEAAYIATLDGKAAYILVIFADDRAYAYDWKIFPQMSRLVFERMTARK